MDIRFIYFDVAYTLLHKPMFFSNLEKILSREGYVISKELIQKNHKLVSEVVDFPVATGSEFYDSFNKLFLESLGVLPDKSLLKKIYEESRGLPWVQFEDVEVIKELTVPYGILSNWDPSLSDKVAQLLPFSFQERIVSAEIGVSKPDLGIFKIAIEKARLEPYQIAFVGDSIKLDIAPATELGIIAILLDRQDMYPGFNGQRIKSLKELKSLS